MDPNIKNPDLVKALLTLNEDERLYPYVDTVGKVTIGVGHNLTDRGISKAISALLLHEDIQEALGTLEALNVAWRRLDPARQAVLIDLAFNLGYSRLSRFKNFLLAVRVDQWAAAVQHLQNSKWWGQVGVRGPRLVHMLTTGTFPPELS